jgi:hypothetical protein
VRDGHRLGDKSPPGTTVDDCYTDGNVTVSKSTRPRGEKTMLSRLTRMRTAEAGVDRGRPTRALVQASALAVAVSVLVTADASAHVKESSSSGGGAIGEVVGGTIATLLIIAGMVLLSVQYRRGGAVRLRRLGAFAERRTALPAWAALPLGVQGGSLLIAVFGMYWDISTHLDSGRDPGPFANASHYFILAGLFGIVLAGVLAVVLPDDGSLRPGRASLKVPKGDWHAPLGGGLILLCGLIALSGFPLDDIWHRIFGQDVTLWGPTHLLLFGAASLSVLGALILYEEGRRSADQTSERPASDARRFRRLGPIALCGALLIGLSTPQGEFDFSVPQFRLALHPALLMIAASIALVTARVYLGRGGALFAALFFILVRGVLTVLVSPVFGHTTLHFPLYLVEAAAIELVALKVSTRRPVVFGLAAGAAVGTAGLAAEWGWSHLWWAVEWPAALLLEGAIVGLVCALAGAVLGAHVGACLNASSPSYGLRAKLAPALAGAAIVAVAAYAIPIVTGPPVSARVTLTEVTPPPERTVQATVALDPPNAADGALWLMSTSWQGVEGRSVVEQLDSVAPGVYRTRTPLPVHGNWKTSIRLARGASVDGLPVYFPADPDVPAAEIPATPTFTRAFIDDKTLLQREQKPGVPGGLKVFSYMTVLLIAILLIGAQVLGLRRFQTRFADVEEPAAARDPAAAGT